MDLLRYTTINNESYRFISEKNSWVMVSPSETRLDVEIWLFDLLRITYGEK